MNEITDTTSPDPKYHFVIDRDAQSILEAHDEYRLRKDDEYRLQEDDDNLVLICFDMEVYEHFLRKRKVIKCPYCQHALTNIDREAKVQLFCFPARKQVRCQIYLKCHKCSNEVGMVLTNPLMT
jgi:hypothetical protein